ncbi:MAG: aminoacyl-histidine dipeptidase [Butyricicoccus sp.]
MAVLEHLEPKGVFTFFEQLCAIPHGSHNTKQVSDWLTAFAAERGLEHVQDADGNVIIIKQATAGYENAAPVIFQGHMDMVCEKAPDCEKDMSTEGLELVIDGDVIRAEGTTLGGDDGIAVAAALAILDADDIPHPRFEAVFTVDEEVGMEGAASIDVSPLKGRRMLNMDSEDEGVFTVSCAGGNLTRCLLPIAREPFAGAPLQITVEGLIGGHSGVEINKGRANANMLLGRVLYAVSRETGLRIAAVRGGLKDNAIPVKAEAEIVAADAETARAVCARMEEAFRNEFCVTDPGVTVRVTDAALPFAPMDADSTQRTLCLLTCAPNGIQNMSADIEGLVQTSLNLGVLSTELTSVEASFCVRSSVATQKQMLVDRLQCLTDTLRGELTVSGDYPGWEYLQESPLRDLMTEVYTEQYGAAPKIEAIHAGVECGMFAGKLPGLDCVSFGPDLFDIHTFRERMPIASVQRTWKLMLEVLKRMK